MLMDKTQIQIAVERLGSQGAMARAIGITQPLVWQWCNGKRPVAAHHCLAIESITCGAVTCHDLRPDVFGESAHNKDS